MQNGGARRCCAVVYGGSRWCPVVLLCGGVRWCLTVVSSKIMWILFKSFWGVNCPVVYVTSRLLFPRWCYFLREETLGCVWSVFFSLKNCAIWCFVCFLQYLRATFLISISNVIVYGNSWSVILQGTWIEFERAVFHARLYTLAVTKSSLNKKI